MERQQDDPSLNFDGAGSQDQDSDDNAYEVCFVVQDVEFFTFKQGFLT